MPRTTKVEKSSFIKFPIFDSNHQKIGFISIYNSFFNNDDKEDAEDSIDEDVDSDDNDDISDEDDSDVDIDEDEDEDEDDGDDDDDDDEEDIDSKLVKDLDRLDELKDEKLGQFAKDEKIDYDKSLNKYALRLHIKRELITRYLMTVARSRWEEIRNNYETIDFEDDKYIQLHPISIKDVKSNLMILKNDLSQKEYKMFLQSFNIPFSKTATDNELYKLTKDFYEKEIVGNMLGKGMKRKQAMKKLKQEITSRKPKDKSTKF